MSPVPPSDVLSDDGAPGGDAPPAPPSGSYGLRKRLRVMGAILAGGIAAALALTYWLGVAVRAQQAAEGYNDADRVYAQVMAEHNAQAVELASLAPNRSENPRVLEFAHEIGTTSAAQTGALAGWLRDRMVPVPGSATTALALVEAGGLEGAGDDGGGDGSGPRAPAGLNHVHGTETDHGMLTPEQITQLARLNGAEFDAALLGALVEHHYGGLQPADEVIADGMDRDARALAKAERQRIRAEVEDLVELLGEL
ncbi:DUF305 domain-containing protein [Myceligenerans pegani]|uniref:DUF305 domain-containing protein n=1 Tax=Myceligenerans pegani TaxID=2776917 RepID=A0ABR9N3M3_9MICO|nr:DUF305 domain-containing protein [Myceligenerans sp. TRM 65318]MBE1877945.1 DUF305 domain-containing protein [Myceligenerans sp. TRM 65318]MBE3020216.1 DUF305 domain-containing protein [Myceligenerans sp. TRM 65318]